MKKRLNGEFIETEWDVVEENWENSKDEELNTIYKDYRLKEPKFISDLRKMLHLERPENYVPITTTIKNIFKFSKNSINLAKEFKNSTYVPSPMINKTKNIIINIKPKKY